MTNDEIDRAHEPGGGNSDSEPARSGIQRPRRRRFAEFAAMAAVVLAASAVGVALWGQPPAKASAKSPTSSAVFDVANVDSRRMCGDGSEANRPRKWNRHGYTGSAHLGGAGRRDRSDSGGVSCRRQHEDCGSRERAQG